VKNIGLIKRTGGLSLSEVHNERIIRVIKSNRMRGAGDVSRVEEVKHSYRRDQFIG